MDAAGMPEVNQLIPFLWGQIHPGSFPSVSLQDGNDVPVIFRVAPLPVGASHFPRDNLGSIQFWLPCRGIPDKAFPAFPENFGKTTPDLGCFPGK